jgi:hypothetical protein
LTRRSTTANSPISTSDRVSARGSRAACSRSEDMVGLRYRGGESSNPLETCRDVGGGVLFGLATEGNISRGDGVDGRVLLFDESANDDAIGCEACAVRELYDPKVGFERSRNANRCYLQSWECCVRKSKAVRSFAAFQGMSRLLLSAFAPNFQNPGYCMSPLRLRMVLIASTCDGCCVMALELNASRAIGGRRRA